MHSIPVILVIIALLASACAKTSFGSGTESAASSTGTASAQNTSGSPSCAPVLQTLTTPIKLLFVVDASGSNAGFSGDDRSATDPNKNLRLGSIQAFFNQYKSNAEFSWGFIFFQGQTATSLIQSSGRAAFTSDPGVMQGAISAFGAEDDDDNTPYDAAMTMAYSALLGDNSSSNTKYVVVFLSDGQPSDITSASAIAADVRRVVNVYPGRVSFNTIYYGDPQPTDSGRLQAMAQVGGGKFLDTNTGGRSFAIENQIQVPGVSCN